MLNIEKYKDEMASNLDDGFNFEYVVKCAYLNASDKNKGNNMLKILDWLCEEYKEPILDDTEREYLKAVCKPFRNEIYAIFKQKLSPSSEFTEIIMYLNDDWSAKTIVRLPPFSMLSGMYKGMELSKHYTLEELGITYDE